jgi:hypothetical protein
MLPEPRYDPAILNISYPEGSTGDIELIFSDAVDFTDMEILVQVVDRDGEPVFSKDSANGDIVREGQTVFILMHVEDTEGRARSTNRWELKIYDLVNNHPLFSGKFIIPHTIAIIPTP